ncbi:MAG TPA: polymer-forming cytoskeletal protein [Nitrolancea sp.]
MSYRPTGAAYGENSGQATEAYSLVDRHSNVEGTFTTDRDLRIEGVLRGTVKCQGLLYVAEGADIDATVEASSIAVAGQLRGSVTCRGKLQLMPTGRVYATVVTESLVINEGAVLEGELRMESAPASHGVVSSTASDSADSGQSVLRRFGGDEEESLPAQRTRQSTES